MQIERIKKPVDWFIATFSVTVMVLLVICVTWQVFSRYVLAIPSTITDEIARFSMIWVALLGAAYTTGLQRHLSIDLFTQNLQGTKKYLSGVIINTFIFLFASTTMVYGGMTLLMRVYASGQISPSMQIPMAYIYFAVPLSGMLIMFYSTLFIADNWLKLRNKEK